MSEDQSPSRLDEGNCPCCNAPLRTRIITQEFPYISQGIEVTLQAEIQEIFCPQCGFVAFGKLGEQARTAAIYKYLGRLPPWEIVAIRNEVGLSQADFADLLGVGRASLDRWERGANMQNLSMNNLLLLLSSAPNRAWLERENRKRAISNFTEKNVINLDRFRALKSQDLESLARRKTKFKLRRHS